MCAQINYPQIHPQFVRVEISDTMKKIARTHAVERSKHIIRQFIPVNAPLNHQESNFIGCVGELMIYECFNQRLNLQNNYARGQVDNGDFLFNGKIYDIKSEGVLHQFYKRIYTGEIRKYEPYGCRVFTSTHAHHLKKYTGGLIFTILPLPDDARENKGNTIRDRIVKYIDHGIVVGFTSRRRIFQQVPTWYSPIPPGKTRGRKYNSKNYIFHHSSLHSIKTLFQEAP